jgi:hypothetical protein
MQSLRDENTFHLSPFTFLTSVPSVSLADEAKGEKGRSLLCGEIFGVFKGYSREHLSPVASIASGLHDLKRFEQRNQIDHFVDGAF